MLVLSLVLRPRLNRLLNIVLSLVHFVTILASCIGGTWVHYLLGSLIEGTPPRRHRCDGLEVTMRWTRCFR